MQMAGDQTPRRDLESEVLLEELLLVAATHLGEGRGFTYEGESGGAGEGSVKRV